MRRKPGRASIERRTRALTTLFAEIVAGLGALSCAPASGGGPEVAPLDPQDSAPTQLASSSPPLAASPPPPSHVDQRPPVVEVGGACDKGVDKSRAGEGAANMVHGLKPKEPVDYVELVLFGMGEGGDSVLMASGKKCGTAKDWRSCRDDIARAAPQGQGFQPGCIPGGCFHGLVVNRGDDVFVLSSAAAIADFLGPIDTPSEAMLIAFANEYSTGTHYGSCDLANGKGLTRTSDGGFELVGQKTLSWCPIQSATFKIRITAKGEVKELQRLSTSGKGPCAGRRPAGFAGPPPPAAGTDAVGAYLLELACLEAASIGAFRTLAAELAEHGAPQRLRASALSARADEVRHARRAAQHARRYGAAGARRTRSPRAAVRPRSLADIARENEVEGCVREAFGALAATYQAAHAADPQLAELFRGIAEDETRHLALALELRDFFRGRLAVRDWAGVERSRARAIRDLKRDLRSPVDARVARLAGVPEPRAALALLERLERIV